jgi:hypothetical protein
MFIHNILPVLVIVGLVILFWIAQAIEDHYYKKAERKRLMEVNDKLWSSSSNTRNPRK